MVQAVSAIEALRAALAAGPTPTPWTLDRTCVLIPLEPHFWAEAYAGTLANAAYIAAACNAAPELLAEVDRLTAERDGLRAALAELMSECEWMPWCRIRKACQRAHPPAPEQPAPALASAPRVPLTDEQIKAAVGASDEFWATSALWIKSVARAIERVHGIAPQPEGDTP